MREATRYGVIDIPTHNIVNIQNDFSRRRRKIQKHLRNPQKRKKEAQVDERETEESDQGCDAQALFTHGKGAS